MVGIGLMISAAVLFFSWQRGIRISEQQAKDYVETLWTLIPEPQGAVPEERNNNDMAERRNRQIGYLLKEENYE